MSEFKFLLLRDGATLYFSVLEMPDAWRGRDQRQIVLGVEIDSLEKQEICVYADGRLEVYLPGEERGYDQCLEFSTCISEAAAMHAEARIAAALIEFARTGGFNPPPAPEAPSGPIYTVAVP